MHVNHDDSSYSKESQLDHQGPLEEAGQVGAGINLGLDPILVELHLWVIIES